VLKGAKGEPIDTLQSLFSAVGGKLHYVERAELDRIAPGATHQGIIIRVLKNDPLTVPELVEKLKAGNQQPVILLDGVEDPQNLGAIMRSAEVLGAGGIIVRKRRAAGLTPAAVKASAGAAFHLPIAETPNLDYAIRTLKDNDYWVYGFDSNGDVSLWDISLTGRLGFVFGAEGAGLAHLTKQRCDRLIRIPQSGRVGSLNVSVSVGVVMAEWLRQQQASR